MCRGYQFACEFTPVQLVLGSALNAKSLILFPPLCGAFLGGSIYVIGYRHIPVISILFLSPKGYAYNQNAVYIVLLCPPPSGRLWSHYFDKIFEWFTASLSLASCGAQLSIQFQQIMPRMGDMQLQVS
jgi:hypothetical protein